MLAYHVDTNAILVSALKSRNDRHIIADYNSMISCLKSKGHSVDLQVHENEASDKCRRTIFEYWNCIFELVPPDVHCCNIDERAIHTFKAHFLSILAGVSDSVTNFLWDQLHPQTELTLNLLRQSTLALDISDWDHFNGIFNFDATPIGLIGCPVIIHNKPGTRLS